MFDSVLMEKVSELLLILIQVAILIALGWARQLKKKAEEYYKSRTTAEQRAVLSVMARDAFAFVEAVYKDLDGPKKLKEAMMMVSRRAREAGLNIDEEDIRAAIESAWLEDKRRVENLPGKVEITSGG